MCQEHVKQNEGQDPDWGPLLRLVVKITQKNKIW